MSEVLTMPPTCICNPADWSPPINPVCEEFVEGKFEDRCGVCEHCEKCHVKDNNERMKPI